MPNLSDLLKDMQAAANPANAANLARFFKTGPGQYGEGDRFLGIKVPIQRQFVRKYRELPLTSIGKLLSSPIHEHRLTGLLILDWQYARAAKEGRGHPHEIVRFYLSHLQNGHINNWDLVDLSAPNILGEYLLSQHSQKKGKPSTDGGASLAKIPILTRLTRSKGLWERRVAIVATAAFIRKGQFGPTLRLAEMLLRDKHDLIHKATGWMLREVGKWNQPLLELFLKKHAAAMPRTMLRYSIERLPEGKRRRYMGA
jgi:3-methyladenine DNA glycosylase AlkD